MAVQYSEKATRMLHRSV